MDKIGLMLSNLESIKFEEQYILSVVIALLVGFLAVALYFKLHKRSIVRRHYLLTGLSEAGKSSIFMRILHKKFPETVTSIKENVGDYKIGGLSGRLVDIPGNFRIREKYFDRYKKTAKGIIFVVDSVTIQKDICDVADALYTILTDAATMACPVVVLCNKQDLSTAKSAVVIIASLEKEMNTVRDTRSRKLKSVGDNAANKSVYLGKEGKDFEWTHLQQNIQFYEGSAKDDQLSDLTDWLDRML